MKKYIARRLLFAVPTIFGATLLVFGVLRILPGDVAQMILGGEESTIRAQTNTLETLRKELGLDRPLPVQYLTWVGDILRGDLGKSLWTGRPIRQELARRAPITFQIAIMALLLALVAGIPLGIFSAMRQNSIGDLTARFFAILFLAIPAFWLGLMILLVGLRAFNWMPPLGRHGLLEDPVANLTQLIFPAAILASHEMARVARMTRSTMLEVLREDYIRTARAKGLENRIVIYRHALKNALIPVVTMVGLYFGALLAGTVVLEYVFSIPGLGSLFLEGIRVRDYTIVQAMVMFLAIIFITINLVVDLTYGWLDPRISYT